MKIPVYRAGVLGTFAVARLAHGGQDVTALARGRASASTHIGDLTR